MNNKCYVAGCSYDGISSTHRLPKNPEVAKYLLGGLGFPDSYQPTSNFRICRQHFSDDSFVKHGERSMLISNPKLKGDQTGIERDFIGSFEELKQRLPGRLETLTEKGWTIFETSEEVYISLIEIVPTRGAIIKANIVINRLKHLTAFIDNKKVKTNIQVEKVNRCLTLTKWSDLKLIIEQLEIENKSDPESVCYEAASLLNSIEPQSQSVERKIKILQCQLKHLISEEGIQNKKRYELDSILMSIELYNVSPACYRTMKKYFSLPYERSLSQHEIGKEKSRIDRQNKTMAGVKRKAEEIDEAGQDGPFTKD